MSLERQGPLSINKLLKSFFGDQYSIESNLDYFSGSGFVGGKQVTIIGTADHASVGVELLLRQSAKILETIKEYPGQPIIFFIDTQGQKLRHFDELLGLNRYMAHLGKCVELARQRSHPVIGIVYGEAVSGGFITSGLVADQCFGLSNAIIRVMGLPAMSRITKVPLEKIIELSKTNPVFAPGVENYYKMGAIQEIWFEGDNLEEKLKQALSISIPPLDQRYELAFQRGGRRCVQPIVKKVLEGG